MTHTQPWKGKTAGGNFGQKFLLFALKYVKVKHFYFVLYPIIPFCLLFARKTNRAIYRYFRNIRGYHWWTAFKANVHTAFLFGRVVIDKFALLAGQTQQFEITITQQDDFQRLLHQDKGFILAGSHIGNFELLGHCLKQDIKPIKGIIFGGESRVMQEYRSSTFKENNVELIPVTNDMSHLFTIKNALDNGEIVTILCDRLFGSSKSIRMDFLGYPAHFPIGAFKLAVQFDIPIMSVFLMKEKGTRYTGHLIPLIIEPTATTTNEKVKSLLTQYVQSLEWILQKYPTQWFNFYDFWNLEDSPNNNLPT